MHALRLAARTSMTDRTPVDPATVFAIVNDPQYNAVRLHLNIELIQDLGPGLVDAQRTFGNADNADVGRGSERS